MTNPSRAGRKRAAMPARLRRCGWRAPASAAKPPTSTRASVASRAAGQHHVGVAAPDDSPRPRDGVTAGGAGRDDAEVGALRAEGDGRHSGARLPIAIGIRTATCGRVRRSPISSTWSARVWMPPMRSRSRAGPLGELGLPVAPGAQPGPSPDVPPLARADVAVVAPLLLAVEDAGGIEALDLGGDAVGQARRIELRDRGTPERPASIRPRWWRRRDPAQ